MKRIFIGLLFFCGIVAAVNAQPRAIGANVGYGIDFSYQNTVVSPNNMIDLSIGLNGFNTVLAVCTYDWIFNINGGWNWYVGPGIGVGFDFKNSFPNVSIGALLGIEYNFNIPFNMSLDYRPLVNVLGFNDSYWAHFYGYTLGLRYRF